MNRLEYIQSKLVDKVKAAQLIQMWQLKGDKVVFTNGCFDILHQGHVSYLASAASEGNRLVLGLNTDDSVKRLGKGDDRPINDEHARAMVLASLGFVDAIVLFDEDTPIDLIQSLEPNILAKGADYDPEETDTNSSRYIVGSDWVKQNGGDVIAIPLIEGFSTTNTLAKIKGND